MCSDRVVQLTQTKRLRRRTRRMRMRKRCDIDTTKGSDPSALVRE